MALWVGGGDGTADRDSYRERVWLVATAVVLAPCINLLDRAIAGSLFFFTAFPFWDMRFTRSWLPISKPRATMQLIFEEDCCTDRG
jgi:hypothetical protein